MDFLPPLLVSCNNVVPGDTLIPPENEKGIHSRAFISQPLCTVRGLFYPANQPNLSLGTRAMTSLLICCAHYGTTER